MKTNQENKYDKMCFVIMPIGELDIYPPDHFKQVYEDIFSPAIEKAGYKAKRADDDNSSNFIQIDIIRDIVNAPIALCDLSTRNPNVLFELGIRQAFDLPVVLVQEKGTPRIFDISSINTIDYDNNMLYRTVKEDVEKITAAIKSTMEKDNGVNSIIKLLEITEASVTPGKEMSNDDEVKFMLQVILNEVRKTRVDVEYNTLAKEIFTSDEQDEKNFRSQIIKLDAECARLDRNKDKNSKQILALISKVNSLLLYGEQRGFMSQSDNEYLKRIKSKLTDMNLVVKFAK